MKQQLKSRLTTAAAIAGVVGIALAPVAASAATSNSTIRATIGTSISITSGTTVTMNIIPAAGGSQSSVSDTVTVTTNNATGYLLSLKDADATLTLTNGANTIAAHSGTIAAPTALANNTWGFAMATGSMTGITNGFDASYSALTDVASSTTKWAGITAADQSLKSTTTAAGGGDANTVWYSAKADPTKPIGNYDDLVTYTAVTH